MDCVDRYLEEVQAAIRGIPREDVRRVVSVIERAWAEGRTVFIIGNGGSAATASHMMNDLSKYSSVPGMPRLRAIALTDNVPLLTAYGNDQKYEDVFVEPLTNLLQPGDVLVAISGSGNSGNVLKACEYAIEHSATVVGLCGQPGGALAQIASHRVVVPADLICQQEDGHLILNHVIAVALRERISLAAQRRGVAAV
jgi:D-sedoheptulose 7-phosphate isomerase